MALTLAPPRPRVREVLSSVYLRMLRVPDAEALRRWDDMQMTVLLERHCKRPRVYELVLGEWDRRAKAERRTAQRRQADLAFKSAHYEAVHAAFLAAEAECNGVLLNKAGIAAGVEPTSLFYGPQSRAMKYASEELRNCWTEGRHARLTLAEFRRQSREGRPE
ncbi:MAG: hypothetical protein JWO67_4706 [Streptosporangiaceae bacterium]|nr:hypothetical protein [Streptosporangiaceae bacterium]